MTMLKDPSVAWQDALRKQGGAMPKAGNLKASFCHMRTWSQ